MVTDIIGNLYDLLMSASITSGNDSLMLSQNTHPAAFPGDRTCELLFEVQLCLTSSRLKGLSRMSVASSVWTISPVSCPPSPCVHGRAQAAPGRPARAIGAACMPLS